MARVEPIPYDELTDDARERIEAGMATGMYTTPLPLQMLAHSSMVVRAIDDGYRAHFRAGAIGPRLQELIRLRSALLNSCEPCSASRKDDEVSETDVACLLEIDDSQYSRDEVLALRFLDLFANDHHAITADTYRELAEVFTPEQVVELGWLSAQSLGIHRLMHTLDVLGEEAPVVRRRVSRV